MADLLERVASLEEEAQAHAAGISEVRHDIAGLRVELRTSIAELRTEIAAVRSEMVHRSELAAVRSEMAELRREMVAGDAALRSEINELRSEMNGRFNAIEQKFLWLAGTQVATLLAVVGVLAGALYR